MNWKIIIILFFQHCDVTNGEILILISHGLVLLGVGGYAEQSESLSPAPHQVEPDHSYTFIPHIKVMKAFIVSVWAIKQADL